MSINLSRMLTPDGADGGSAAPAASPSTPASVPAASGGQQQGAQSAPPQQQPAGNGQQADERARQQQAEHTRLWQNLNAKGIRSPSDLDRAVEIANRFGPLANDPRASRLLEALNEPPKPDPASLPVNLETVGQLFDAKWRENQARSQQEQAQRDHQSAAVAEQRLIDTMFADQKFAKLTNGQSFEACRSGAAGTPAMLAAILVDEMVLKATQAPSGYRNPMTDAAQMRAIFDNVAKELSSFKADLLLASAGGQAAQGGGTPAGLPSGAAVVGSPQGESMATDRERRAREAQNTFRQQFERLTGQAVVA